MPETQENLDWSTIPCHASGCKRRVAAKLSDGRYCCVDHVPERIQEQARIDDAKSHLPSVYDRAIQLLKVLPSSREVSLAITNLEQSQLWLEKAIGLGAILKTVVHCEAQITTEPDGIPHAASEAGNKKCRDDLIATNSPLIPRSCEICHLGPCKFKPTPAKEYTAWLIETESESGPRWLCDDHEAPRLFSWTSNANEAIHFSREVDAQSVMECAHVGHGLLTNGKPMRVFASEHSWPDGL